MTWILAGDVGGTKTLLYVANLATGEYHQQRYATQNYDNFLKLITAFQQEVGVTPSAACLGVAGPVQGNRCIPTNINWVVDGDAVAEVLGIPQVRVINDFVAVAYGILTLSQADLYCLQPGQPRPYAPIAVIGAGTGLGQAYLTWTDGGYKVYGSEGGHSSFAPQNPLEAELLGWLWHQYPQVTVERVVSGQGIVHIYEFLASRSPHLPSLDYADTAEPAGVIASAVHTNPLAKATMDCFVSAYGAEAGNIALRFLPYGGLYIAGGIAPKILPLLTADDRFLQAMHNKEKLGYLLRDIPTYVVLNPEVGLWGALHQARQMVV